MLMMEPEPPLEHVPSAVPREVPQPEQVDLDHAAERLVVGVLAGQAPQVGDAGVVDEDVDAPVGGERGGHDRGDRLGVGDIGRVDADLATVALAQPGRVLLEQLGRAGGQRDVRAGPGQRVGEREPEAHGTTGDERHLSRQVEHLHPPSRVTAAT